MTYPVDAEQSGTHPNRGSILLAELNRVVVEDLKVIFGRSLMGVVLFGSAARGSMRVGSDIDLLIVLSPETTLDRDIYDKFPGASIDGHEVSPLFVSFPLPGQELRSVWLEAAVDGIVLFDDDLALTRLFSRIRTKIVEGKVRRCLAYGVPYWVNEECDTRSTKS